MKQPIKVNKIKKIIEYSELRLILKYRVKTIPIYIYVGGMSNDVEKD